MYKKLIKFAIAKLEEGHQDIIEDLYYKGIDDETEGQLAVDYDTAASMLRGIDCLIDAISEEQCMHLVRLIKNEENLVIANR